MRAKIRAVSPVLPSRDVNGAIEFYVERLGFTLLSRDSERETKYAVIARDGAELHIQWHDPREWAAVERPSLRFFVPSVEKLYQEYERAGVFHENTGLREAPWGTREFAFFDPDKNGLTFYKDL